MTTFIFFSSHIRLANRRTIHELMVITNVTKTMRLFNEEIFGPVAAVLSFDTEEEVIEADINCDAGPASLLFT